MKKEVNARPVIPRGLKQNGHRHSKYWTTFLCEGPCKKTSLDVAALQSANVQASLLNWSIFLGADHKNEVLLF